MLTFCIILQLLAAPRCRRCSVCTPALTPLYTCKALQLLMLTFCIIFTCMAVQLLMLTFFIILQLPAAPRRCRCSGCTPALAPPYACKALQLLMLIFCNIFFLLQLRHGQRSCSPIFCLTCCWCSSLIVFSQEPSAVRLCSGLHVSPQSHVHVMFRMLFCAPRLHNRATLLMTFSHSLLRRQLRPFHHEHTLTVCVAANAPTHTHTHTHTRSSMHTGTI